MPDLNTMSAFELRARLDIVQADIDATRKALFDLEGVGNAPVGSPAENTMRALLKHLESLGTEAQAYADEMSRRN